jgi:hypothetical protein
MMANLYAQGRAFNCLGTGKGGCSTSESGTKRTSGNVRCLVANVADVVWKSISVAIDPKQ